MPTFDELPQYDDLFHTTLFGVPILQRWTDLWLLEEFFQQAPELRGVIELGTWQGGLSLYLRIQTMQRGQRFWTFDKENNLPENWNFERIGLSDCMVLGDLWGEGGAILRTYLSNDHLHPLLLVCDGGDKPREAQTFAPLLRPGDYVAVHDWGNEVNHADLVNIEHLLEPVMLDACVYHRSLLRFWRRTAEDEEQRTENREQRTERRHEP